VISAAFISATRAAEAPATAENLLQKLIVENRRSLDRITSFRYDGVAMFRDSRVENVRHDLLVAGQGDSEYKEVRRPLRMDGAPTTAVVRYFRNPDVIGFWHKGNPLAYTWELSPEKPFPADARLLIDSMFLRIDPLLRAFGDGEYPLDRAMTAARMGTRWDAIEIDSGADKGKYLIRRFELGTSDATNPTFSYLIDPKQGYAVTRATGYYPPGRPTICYTLKMSAFNNDVWFPVEMVERRYDANSDANPRPMLRETTLLLQNVVLNQYIPESSFELDALGLPEGLRVVHTASDGAKSSTTAPARNTLPSQTATTAENSPNATAEDSVAQNVETSHVNASAQWLIAVGVVASLALVTLAILALRKRIR